MAVVWLSTVTAADAVQFSDWMAMAGEAHGDALGWTGANKYDCRICVVIPTVSLPD